MDRIGRSDPSLVALLLAYRTRALARDDDRARRELRYLSVHSFYYSALCTEYTLVGVPGLAVDAEPALSHALQA